MDSLFSYLVITMRVLLMMMLLLLAAGAFAATTDSTDFKPANGYQIHLSQPAKAIKLLLYEKNFLPIRGELSEDRKSVIMQDYQPGNKVRVKVEYEDGTFDEFIKSSCYIDPVIL